MPYSFILLLTVVTINLCLAQPHDIPYKKTLPYFHFYDPDYSQTNKNSHKKNRITENFLFKVDSIKTLLNGENSFNILKPHYNDEVMLSDISAYRYNTTGGLVFLSNLNVTYTPNGTIQYIYTLDWLFEEQKWDTIRKVSYHYDDNNLLIKTEEFDGPDWELFSKVEFAYDFENRLLNKKRYYANYNWQIQSQTDYIYLNEKLIEEIYSFWFIDQWEVLRKVIYTYDTFGNNIEEVHWETSLSTLAPLSPYKKVETLYDISVEQKNVLQLPLPYQQADNYHMPTAYTEYNYEEDSQEWIEVRKSEFFYSPFTITGIQSGSINVFNIHPNPCTDVIRLNLDDNTTAIFELYDQLGAKVLSQNAKGNETISIQSLPAGLYNCVLTSENEKYFTRLVKSN